MKKETAVNPAPTAAPVAVEKAGSATATPAVIRKTVFVFKKRKPIAPAGLQNSVYIVAVNEEGREGGNKFNRLHTVIEVTDEAKNRYEVVKDYNTLPNGRGINAFLQDYNAWSGAELKEDDLYNEFDMDEKVKGKTLVVEIGHRKVGKEWEAYIIAFHPAGHTAEVTA